MEADTLMGNAAVFRATGDTWTVGTRYFDGINYGLFYSDHVMECVIAKIGAEARRLKIRKLLIGECGHASRTAKAFYPAFSGDGHESLPVVSIIEYTYQSWKRGRLKLRPGAIEEPVTYHDPCNLARNGWVVDQPRELLEAFCANYLEMTPGGRANICCCGGRTGESGADPCHRREVLRRTLMEYYKIDCQIVGLHDLLYGGRVFHAGARKLSRPQEFVWPLLLVIPFVTGYVCANSAARPETYQAMMFLHVYSADLIMLMLPFTKLAHCVLVPLSQAVTAVAWKFPPGAGGRVAATLGYADRPSWLEGARLQSPPRGLNDEVCAR
jgi:hypothetical protein